MQPTARSLILDLLSTLRRGSMPVRALVEAGALLGIEENNIRVTIARLYSSGRLERDERGRYRLGPAVAAMSSQLRSWREIGNRKRTWRGDWVAIHISKLGRGPARRRREQALALLGFRMIDSSLALRPNNLRGGVEGMRTQFVDFMRMPDSPSPHKSETTSTPPDSSPIRVFRLSDLDAAGEKQARGLWDANSLIQETRAAAHALSQSEAGVHALTNDEAMVETFLVGGRVLRHLVRHPLLPEEILDPTPLDSLLDAMKSYDRIGRSYWAQLLARHDVPHRSFPLDSRDGALDRPIIPMH